MGSVWLPFSVSGQGCKFTYRSWTVTWALQHFMLHGHDLPTWKLEWKLIWVYVWGAEPLNGSRVLLLSFSQWVSWGRGPHNLFSFFKLHSGKTIATCLSGTSWAPVSKFKLSWHVVYTIPARSRFHLIHRASELHEYKMKNRRDCRCFCPALDNQLKGIFDFNKKFGRELVHKVV